MSQGVIIFAFNNSEIDYVELAIYSAKRIKEYLGKPVTLITDSSNWLYKKFPSQAEIFDKIIESSDTTNQTKRFYDGNFNYKNLVWKNSNRVDCFSLSPYDETLVIDSDFLINSDTLKYCWDQPHDFLIFKDSNDLSGWRQNKEFDYVSEYSVDFYWATVFFFRKTENTRIFFSLLKHIKNQWTYYSKFYRLMTTNFRNDMAFSIAIHIMNGYGRGDFARPFFNKLHYILDRDFIVDDNNKTLKFLVQKPNKSNEYMLIKTHDLDVHVMNKVSLLKVVRKQHV
jgi:hypothetical protein